MSAIASELPTAVQGYLRRYALRRALQRIIRCLGLAVLLTIVWGLAWCIVDRMIALPVVVRAALLSVNLAAVALIVGRAIARLVWGADWRQVAIDIERREPDWQEKLATLASCAIGPKRYAGSPQLLSALGKDVAEQAARRNPKDLLPWGPVLRPWIASALAMAVAATLILSSTLDLPRLARRYLGPWSAVAPAATTRLFVTPGDARIAAGDVLRVRAAAQRLDEGGVTLHLHPIASAEQDWAEQPMSSTPDRAFEARVANLSGDVEYFVTGGDARSDVYRVTVLRRPAVVAFHVTCAYPPHLKLPPLQTSNDDGVIEAPIGSEATIQIEASEPLSSATLTVGPQPIATVPTTRPGIRQAKLTIRDNRPLDVRLVSADGVEGRFAGGSVRAIMDRPPLVLVDPPPATAYGNGSVQISYQAADDFGLARLDAEVTGPSGAQRSVTVPLVGDARQQRGFCTVDVASMGLKPGQAIDVRLRAEDRAGQLTLSSPARLEIGSPAAAAQSPPPAAGGTHPLPDSSQPPDPPGFSDAIRAYFAAISRR